MDDLSSRLQTDMSVSEIVQRAASSERRTGCKDDPKYDHVGVHGL
jgi:hypothetical protein